MYYEKKYFKKISQQRAKKEIKTIQNFKLPNTLKQWVAEYEKVGERNIYIWQWLYRMFHVIRLPIVPKKYKTRLLELKTLLTMFDVLLDDIADITTNNKRLRLMEELIKIPFERKKIQYYHLSIKDKKYLRFTRKLWRHIIKEIKTYPNYDELLQIFKFDIYQMLSVMKYSRIINSNYNLINKTEYWLYLPHNMAFMHYSMLDLMCSSRVNLEKVGLFRELTWEFQKMGRISNWITTWRREIKDRDYSSGVFAYAIDKDVLTTADLRNMPINKIEQKITKSKVEFVLFKDWKSSRNKIQSMSNKINKKIIKHMLNSQEHLLVVDLISEGRK